MRKTYLYKLFKHSVPAFLLVCFLLVCYTVIFSKKMDMVIFPYNSMYAVDLEESDTSTTYALKIDGQKLHITNKLYWKKDFLETALNGYCAYIRHGNRVFLQDYLEDKIPNRNTRNKFLDKLTPPGDVKEDWPLWYAGFAGYNGANPGKIEILAYKFLMNQNALLVDSTLIWQMNTD